MNNQRTPYEQPLGGSGKKNLSFNRKKPLAGQDTNKIEINGQYWKQTYTIGFESLWKQTYLLNGRHWALS